MSYQRTFLSDVILRVDFVSIEESLKKTISPDVRNICVKYFPIPEERNVETQQVLVTNEPGVQNTVLNKEQFLEWHFFGKEKEKELCISSNCMFVDIKRYTSFIDLQQQFFEIMDVLLQKYPAIRINRIGLRYVNQISLPSEKKPRNSWHNYWNKYISDALVKSLAFVDNDSALARHMSSVEMNYGDYLLRFQYGIFNPDYPAANKKNIYVIDTDIYATGLIDSDDVKAYAAEFHAKANEWFEKAIKQELRDKLGGAGTHA